MQARCWPRSATVPRACQVSIHPTRTDRLRDLVVPSGIHAAGTHGFGPSGASSIDGYLSTDALAEARHTLRVRDSNTGAHLLRVVADGLAPRRSGRRATPRGGG
jgi:hypothetical protein